MSDDRHARTSFEGERSPKRPSNGDGSATREADGPERGQTVELDALAQLLRQFRQLREYLAYYLAAKTDGVRLSLRSTIVWLVLAALGFVAVAGIIIAAFWVLVNGTAEGLGVLFGGRAWAGKIVAGFIFLALLGLSMRCTSALRMRAFEKGRSESMTNANEHNKPSSGAVCMTGRRTPENRDERAIVAAEAANAQAAMLRTLHEMKETLQQLDPVSSVARRHPWLATGSAVAIGFATGAVLTSPRGRDARNARLDAESQSQPGTDGQRTAGRMASFLFSTLGTALTGILTAVLQGSLSAVVVGKDRTDNQSPPKSADAAAADN